MTRSWWLLFVVALSVWLPASAAPLSPIERAMEGLVWGMGQADVRMRLKYDLSEGEQRQALLRDLPALRPDERVLTGSDHFARVFYLFRAGKLRKVYKAFEPSVFPEGNFSEFVSNLEKSLGRGKLVTGELRPGLQRRWVEWRHKQTRLRALDETQYLGCYVLLYELAR